MRYFFSTGEASGELAAVMLARAIRELDSDANFEGIGAQRMRDAGFVLWRDNTGWASFGPFAAIPRIPKLALAAVSTVSHVRNTSPDAVVLVDFGAFNVRLAQRLRRAGYRGAIVDVFPPGAWLDSVRTARAVTSVAVALSAFEHQYEFYRASGLPAAYFGHPLAPGYAMRPPRPAPSPDAGTVAILPGSRPAELRHHGDLVMRAFTALKRTRPHVRGIVGAPNERAQRDLRRAAQRARAGDLRFEHGTAAAIADADAALVASGTAVLECALSGVPSVAFYVVSRALARYVRRVYSRAFYTIPNLVLDREIVPELMQERATPQALAAALDAVLADPQRQYGELRKLREALGPADALERCAALIVAAARGAAA